jgi:hypothetical protein
MTPLHARPKAYRNLNNARRVSNRDGKSEETLDRAFDKETAAMIDEGWKHFWRNRGKNKPPYVSSRTVGVFDII